MSEKSRRIIISHDETVVTKWKSRLVEDACTPVASSSPAVLVFAFKGTVGNGKRTAGCLPSSYRCKTFRPPHRTTSTWPRCSGQEVVAHVQKMYDFMPDTASISVADGLVIIVIPERDAGERERALQTYAQAGRAAERGRLSRGHPALPSSPGPAARSRRRAPGPCHVRITSWERARPPKNTCSRFCSRSRRMPGPT